MNQTILELSNGKRYSRTTNLTSSNLIVLSEFLFDLGVGEDPNVIKWLKEAEGMGFNSSSFEKEYDKIRVYLDYFPGIKDLVILQSELLKIVEKWMELTEKRADKIILTEEDDGSFTIKEGKQM